MKLDSQQKKIIDELCIKYNLTKEEIFEIIQSPFIFIRKEIKEINFTGLETEEEFNKKVKNFNIPSIGKLYGNYFNFKRINNGRKECIKKRENK